MKRSTILAAIEAVKKIKPIYEPRELVQVEDLSDPDVIDEVELEPELELLPVADNLTALEVLVKDFKITRNIKELFLHCTGTYDTATVDAIVKYWKEKKKWKSPGYHIIVKPNGEWVFLLDFNLVSNGVQGRNSTSINICYIGGKDKTTNRSKDTRTLEQKEVESLLVKLFKEKIQGIKVRGHNEVSDKSCPCFDVQKEYNS
jgi:N-acetylmuramoyl-L-alanine amidase